MNSLAQFKQMPAQTALVSLSSVLGSFFLLGQQLPMILRAAIHCVERIVQQKLVFLRLAGACL